MAASSPRFFGRIGLSRMGATTVDGSKYSQIFDCVADDLSMASHLYQSEGVDSVVVDSEGAWKAMSRPQAQKC